ncbi:MAG TPA: hypothetical protein DCR40_21270 [Prolixibacteraceae bacterium]|nr:hypothetical protein [Prolixibacteraceae bacterium]
MGLIPGIGTNGFVGTSPSYGKYRILVSNYKIWVSSNYGITWTASYYRSSGFNNTALAFISDTGQYMMVFAVSGGGLYWSSNYGGSFTNVDASASTAAMSRTGQYVYKTVGSNFYKSTDYGGTWSSAVALGVTPSIMGCSGNGAIIELPVNGTYNHIRSANYGVSWGSAGFAAFYQYALAMSNTGQYALSSGKPNSYTIPEVSSDYGINFSSTSGIGSVASRGIVSETGQYMLVGGYNNIYKSINYGVTWTPVAIVGSWNNVSMSNTGQYQVATTTTGMIAQSSDYGATWTLAFEDHIWLGYSSSFIVV